MMGIKNRAFLVVASSLFLIISSCVTETKTGTREKRADATKRLGVSLIQEGKIKAGVNELLKAVELNPSDPEIHAYLGTAYREMKVYDRAIAQLKKALELKPKYPEAQNDLGTVYLVTGRLDLAIEMFEAAVADMTYRRPYSALNNLGVAYHQKMKYAKAVHYYSKAVEAVPEYSAAYDNMGLSYEMLGQWDNAIKAYEKAVQTSPNEPLYHLHLGTAYLKVGRNKKAIEEFHRTIENDESGVYKNEARGMLERAKKK